MYLAFAGGVGGAKLALGLSSILPPEDLLVVVNTGDDFDHLGLRICPDIDTVTYTLAGIANPETGWGVQGETWNAMDALGQLGGETWFSLGDRDLATHIERTQRLQSGETLSAVTARFAKKLGVRHHIAPATDDPIRTIVNTTDGPMPFQEYFVKRQCAPVVTGFEFAGASTAKPSTAVASAFDSGEIEWIIYCPSNPYVSIAPIIAVPAIGDFIRNSGVPVIAVSPIVGGNAIKGPAAKIMRELGRASTALAVAEHYRDSVSAMVIDTVDSADADAVRALGLQVVVTDTVMKSDAEKARLADETLAFARTLSRTT
jgi:LPPG:FO 2-phospho-L-lactate transferase